MIAEQPLNDKVCVCMCVCADVCEGSVSDCQVGRRSNPPFVFYAIASLIAPGMSEERRGEKKKTK